MGSRSPASPAAQRQSGRELVIALAGNPNVGKSTVFNALTGMNQHTGNWPGKTVATAQGRCRSEQDDFLLVDLPGTYSLLAHSAEEEVARDFICFGGADATIVVCDATCLERSLNLALQIIEMTDRVVVCVNLLDEARKKHLRIDLSALEQELGVPVVGTSARSRKGLNTLLERTAQVARREYCGHVIRPHYTPAIEKALAVIEACLKPLSPEGPSVRWLAVRLLCGDQSAAAQASAFLGYPLKQDPAVCDAVARAHVILSEDGIEGQKLLDQIAACPVLWAEGVAAEAVFPTDSDSNARDRRLDRIFTSRRTGIPVMLLLLFGVLWLTIAGANVPSQWLAGRLFAVQDWLSARFMAWGAPDWLHGALVLGVYRVLAWVVSVMLPPMAIFFPLFTLLEDFGYLPRVAFNLDHCFKKACTCGKQALTMCMSFGCNAVGVTGCRIIDSPRERLIAVLTSSLVPCNGRFPAMLTILSLFFVGAAAGPGATLLSALLLTAVIVLGVGMTFLCSRLLSRTLLRGVPSGFTLELPPYRMPQFGRVIVRSVFDRTLFVLGRAVSVAAPAGLVIWLLANVIVNDVSLLTHISGALDPFARVFGLDGVILLAFILGFPANEIVIPIAAMAYLSTGTIAELGNTELHALLLQNGWTPVTALCTVLFSLFHWPCSTTCLTIHRETGSLRWTLAAIALPTVIGFSLCFLVASAARLLGIS